MRLKSQHFIVVALFLPLIAAEFCAELSINCVLVSNRTVDENLFKKSHFSNFKHPMFSYVPKLPVTLVNRNSVKKWDFLQVFCPKCRTKNDPNKCPQWTKIPSKSLIFATNCFQCPMFSYEQNLRITLVKISARNSIKKWDCFRDFFAHNAELETT